MVSGHKQGFCVIDVYPSNLPCNYPLDPPKYDFCEETRRRPASQGLSVCWNDEYYFGYDGQWVDITGLPAGEYVLENEVNAERFFVEADYSNNAASVQVTIF
jgi:hypothetical protein